MLNKDTFIKTIKKDNYYKIYYKSSIKGINAVLTVTTEQYHREQYNKLYPVS